MPAEDLQTLPSVAILDRLLLEHHALFKDAVEVLRGRPPDDETARVVLDAFESDRIPPWLAALLLGALRGPVSYTIVRGILESGPGLLAESYAGVAMARIAGAEARADLLRILREGQRRVVREGALYGLGFLGDATTIDDIVRAMQDELVLPTTAGHVMAGIEMEGARLTDWLRSEDERTRRFALEIVLCRKAPIIDDAVITAGAAALTQTRLSPSVRKKLEAKLGS